MCLIALQGIREFKLESAIVHRVKVGVFNRLARTVLAVP